MRTKIDMSDGTLFFFFCAFLVELRFDCSEIEQTIEYIVFVRCGTESNNAASAVRVNDTQQVLLDSVDTHSFGLRSF